MSEESSAWYTANQQFLVAALSRLRERLAQHAGQAVLSAGDGEQAILDSMPAPPALETLAAAFGLSSFERDILLLCAGVELDSSFPALCAAAQGDAGRGYPTFSLALACLAGPHWSALTPGAPLRWWRLIDIGAGSLTLSPLQIDERVLHYLAGIQYHDERLAGLAVTLPPPSSLVPSQERLAGRLADIWDRGEGSAPAAVQLCGDDRAGKRAIAAAACAALGLRATCLHAGPLPPGGGELDALLRLWHREAILDPGVLVLDCDDLEGSDGARLSSLSSMLETLSAPLLVLSRDRWHWPLRPLVALDVRRPSADEQRSLWKEALPGANGRVDVLVSQFALDASAIRLAAQDALSRLSSTPDGDLGDYAWDACRAQTRPRLDDLAQRIEPAAVWDDLVLPERQRATLREIAAHVRRRSTVYETWGLGRKGSRGLGISALFSGGSGTGKTMAAEVLAAELRLDLYRIDLSAVVSKYIGETEKNLRRVFDAAEEGGAILLFDEADALFGKRSEVKDSHDRYANIEISYLLQRMEAYRGLAILTTNMKNALDSAFLRRIRFIVHFPFPDASQRAEIWRRIYPAETPRENLDLHKLARLNVAGGNIRNIAVNAAFIAAEAGQPIRMSHVLSAAQTEYAKTETPLTEAEIGGWV